MSDTTNDPQPYDPPVNTGGGGSDTAQDPPEEIEDDGALAHDPPVNTGGGGGS